MKTKFIAEWGFESGDKGIKFDHENEMRRIIELMKKNFNEEPKKIEVVFEDE